MQTVYCDPTTLEPIWMRLVPATLVLLILTPALRCQTAPVAGAQTAPPAAPTYTLQTTARAVVTDVLVQDGRGNPIHGLPASAFHLFDNGRPVALTGFEEHTGPSQTTLLGQPPTGTYTNDPARLPPVLDIIVIDLVALSLPDQMYLSFQLERFLRAMPAGTTLAVYLRAGTQAVLLQDFTPDRQRLIDAVHGALPHFAEFGAMYQPGLITLQQIADDLKTLPGRKNVLWFTGGFPVSFDPLHLNATPSLQTRPLFDTLETERIAVYPVDARGLLVDTAFGDSAQHGLMQEVADATGGIAFYNDNGLQQIAQQVVENDTSFYTLTYTPANLQVDNKWHKIKVRADGRRLHLSYRRGYFADDDHVAKPGEEVLRTRLLKNGRTVQERPSERRAPIVFNATVDALAGTAASEHPVPPGIHRYRVRYAVPATAFQRKSVAAESQLTVGIAVAATNRNGTPLLRRSRQVVFAVDERRLALAPTTPVRVDQEVDLPAGDTFLYLVVWDPSGERVGTLSIPLQVPK